MEGLGLAVASETPMVMVNVMRGGPSTGLPTKVEQGDLLSVEMIVNSQASTRSSRSP